MSSKRILVTGGAGYIGSVLTGKLLAAGHTVTVVDNLLYGIPSLLYLATNPKFKFVRGDARDRKTMEPLVAEADVIIPLAAIVGLRACARDPRLAESINYGAVALINELREERHWVISPGSITHYGTVTTPVVSNEDVPMEPTSVYDETKIRAERALLDVPNSISLRLATVFGPSPRMRIDLLVNDFTYRAVVEGFLVVYDKELRRNYVHIEDVADAFLFCLNRFENMKGQAYNVCLSSDFVSKAELAVRIQLMLPTVDIYYSEAIADIRLRSCAMSSAKINAAGFRAERSLQQGISELITAVTMLPQNQYTSLLTGGD